MATAAKKAAYDEKVKPLRSKLTALGKTIDQQKLDVRKMDPKKHVDVAKLRLALIKNLIIDSSINMVISRIAIEKLGIKNENFLNNARKNLYLIIQYFEEMVGKIIDTGFEENFENVQHLDAFTDNLERFELFKHIGFLIHKLEVLYGEGSKWKWSFVELEGRMVTAFKNCINFKELQKNLDPSVAGYPERMDLLRMIIDRVENAAERYRSKYELTGKPTVDMKAALQFIAFKKRLAIVQQDDPGMVDECTKKYDTWNKKLTEDMEEADKKARH